MFDEMEVIHTYSRADAIQDGVLINVEQSMLERVGFNYPTAITNTVWDKYVLWTDEDSQKQCSCIQLVRLGHILASLRQAIRSQKQSDDFILFDISVVPRDGESTERQIIQLKSICHGGDNHEPVLTIMMPNED